MRKIGYGAMLGEGFVALIALVTIMIATPESMKGLSPGTIYGNGIGQFMTLIIGASQMAFAVTFGAMAFSTFVFDTLDADHAARPLHPAGAVRVARAPGRDRGDRRSRSPPVHILFFAQSGGWLKFWTLFGASNQLLAALTLLTLTVWLHRARRRIAFTLIPMLFVLTITFWAIVKLLIANAKLAHGFDIAFMNAISAGALTILALFLVASALVRLREDRASGVAVEAS